MYACCVVVVGDGVVDLWLMFVVAIEVRVVCGCRCVLSLCVVICNSCFLFSVWC